MLPNYYKSNSTLDMLLWWNNNCRKMKLKKLGFKRRQFPNHLKQGLQRCTSIIYITFNYFNFAVTGIAVTIVSVGPYTTSSKTISLMGYIKMTNIIILIVFTSSKKRHLALCCCFKIFKMCYYLVRQIFFNELQLATDVQHLICNISQI